MDFTVDEYIKLLKAFMDNGYSFCTFENTMKMGITDKMIILRHDVDKRPADSLRFAIIENKLGICGSYYFRSVNGSWNEKIVLNISHLGHEIGYHYEDIDLIRKKQKNIENLELFKRSIISFNTNLEYFRTFVPVSTICMHGSPLSKYDNKDIWSVYDYRNFEIIGEPYFDIDFSKVAYYTDSGRRWNGNKFIIRDRPSITKSNNRKQELGEYKKMGSVSMVSSFPIFRSTNDIINSLYLNKFPNNAMLTLHPQRWSNEFFSWFRELVFQNVKNVAKYCFLKYSFLNQLPHEPQK